MDPPDPEWWRSGFGPAYLELYDGFLAERTPSEIDQFESLLQLRPPLRILDLPCGQGRHSIELARRGYQVTGADISPEMLAVARQRARRALAKVRFVEADMRQPLPERFDLVLNLFTSFGYFADEADDVRVARAAAAMLVPGGRFLLEVINGDRLMANFDERGWFTVGDTAVMEERSLDRSSRVMLVERTVVRDGQESTDGHRIRLYGANELRHLLGQAQFESVELYGDWDGSRASQDSARVIAVASIASSSSAP
jgi:SAM-dependent methyltransferase